MRTILQRTHLLHRKVFHSPADPGDSGGPGGPGDPGDPGARGLFEMKMLVFRLLASVDSSNPHNVPQPPRALAQYAVHILRFWPLRSVVTPKRYSGTKI
jgi:hypothetical protein